MTNQHNMIHRSDKCKGRFVEVPRWNDSMKIKIFMKTMTKYLDDVDVAEKGKEKIVCCLILFDYIFKNMFDFPFYQKKNSSDSPFYVILLNKLQEYLNDVNIVRRFSECCKEFGNNEHLLQNWHAELTWWLRTYSRWDRPNAPEVYVYRGDTYVYPRKRKNVD